jgi:two-component system sensor kinase FixL
MSSPSTRPHANPPPPQRLAAALRRNKPEIVEAWARRIRHTAAGRRLAGDLGEAALQKALSRAFLSLGRSLTKPSSCLNGAPPFNELLRKSVKPVWVARWCVSLFDICRDTLDGDHRISPRDLLTFRNLLLSAQERSQAALLVAGMEQERRNATSRLEEVLEARTRDLRSAHARYMNLVERLEDIIFTLDSRSRFDSVSGRGLKSLGLTAGDLIGKSIFAVTPARYRRHVRQLRRRLLEEKRLRGVTVRTVDSKGEEIVLEISASLVAQNGRPGRVLGIARDITSRIRLEEEVRESKEYLELLVESSVDGIVATDRNGEITLFNHGAEEIFGYRAEEVLRKPVGAFFAVPDDGGGSLFDLLASGGGRIRNRECVCRGKDGREIVVSYSASLLHDKTGEVIGLISGCKDITDRRRAEEKIQAKNEELEAYARTVSHDLRGPLVSINGFSSLLEEACGERLTQSGRQYLARIQENARTMGRLISDVLEYSTAGRKTGAPYWVRIGPVIQCISEELGPQLGRAGVRLEVEPPLPQVLADETRLRQVFSNLIANALKHLDGVENPVIKVSAEPAERGHVICVADNGRGMSREVQDRIFDLFFTHGSPKGEGATGLGLAIVEKTVESYGGRVWVESAPGRGARFYLHFPETKS